MYTLQLDNEGHYCLTIANNHTSFLNLCQGSRLETNTHNLPWYKVWYQGFLTMEVIT